MATATFNSSAVGDGVIALESSAERTVVERPVSGVDGIVTRDRGGGRLVLKLRAYKLCASYPARLDYLRGLRQSMGNGKASLVITPASGGPATTFADCLVLAASESRTAGNYVEFEVVFVSSVF